MEALSALAIVAQRSVLPAGQEAIQKAILEADLERTRLDYERSRMLAEDNRIKVRNELLNTTQALVAANERVNTLREERSVLTEDLLDEVTKNVALKEEILNLEDEFVEMDNEIHERYLIHTNPSDTEVNDRRKFIRLFFS